MIFHCRRSSSVSSRTWFNTPCVTAEDSKRNTAHRSEYSAFHPDVLFFSIFSPSSKFGAISEKKKKGEKNRTFYFLKFFLTGGQTLKSRSALGAQSIPRTLLIGRPARLPSTGEKKKERKKLAGESRKKKGRSLLTLHARGYSVESNSQGYRYICIPLEEEDKLNQHFDIDAAAAGCWRSRMNPL